MNPKILDFPLVAVDTETTGLDPWHGDCPFIVSFCNQSGETGFMEWPVNPKTRKVTPNPKDLTLLRWFFEESRVTKVFHHAKFDIRMIEVNFGIHFRGTPEDTMLMAHGCNSDEPTLALKPLASKYLGIEQDDQDSLKAAVIRLRRRAKKLGWKTANKVIKLANGKTKNETNVEADYWLVQAFAHHHPEVLEEMGIDPNLASTYAVRDVERTMLLFHLFQEGLWCRQEEFDNLFQKLVAEEGRAEALRQYPVKMNTLGTYAREKRLWPVIYGMETRGVRLDVPACQAEADKCIADAKRYGDELRAIGAKHGMLNVNLDYAPSLAKLLFGRMGLKPNPNYLTDGGEASVSQEALEVYRAEPVVQKLLHYRGACKAYGTFFNKYLNSIIKDSISPGCWSLRTENRQVGPRTGRLSAANPNLMQVANANTSKSLEPIQARGVFGPRPGYVWIANDYAGQEICVFADVAQEPQMMAALRAGRSVHAECANIVWGGEGNEGGVKAVGRTLMAAVRKEPDEGVLGVWKRFGVRKPTAMTLHDWMGIGRIILEENKWDIIKAEKSFGRKNSYGRIKQLEFLKIYGGGYPACADQLKCSMDEAVEVMDAFDERFPRINEFSQELQYQSKRDGFVVTKYGRRLAVPEDRPYACVNYLVQGTAADQMKESMIRLSEYLPKTELDVHIVLVIHDELVFEVAETDITVNLLRGIYRCMCEHEGVFSVPMKVEPKLIRSRWSESVPLEIK